MVEVPRFRVFLRWKHSGFSVVERLAKNDGL